jgi:hypothetical protein
LASESNHSGKTENCGCHNVNVTKVIQNLTRNPSIRKGAVFAFSYIVAFAVTYALITALLNKQAVNGAVGYARAYWEEEQRLNDKRLFGNDE